MHTHAHTHKRAQLDLENLLRNTLIPLWKVPKINLILKQMKHHVPYIAAHMQNTAPSGIDLTQFTVKEYLRFIRAALDPKEFGC